MKLTRAKRKVKPGLVFADKPSVAQIKHALFQIPVLFVQEQATLRSQRNPDQVWPPDWAIFEGEKFYDHSCNRDSFMVKLHDKIEEVEKRSGKKPFVITTRVGAV